MTLFEAVHKVKTAQSIYYFWANAYKTPAMGMYVQIKRARRGEPSVSNYDEVVWPKEAFKRYGLFGRHSTHSQGSNQPANIKIYTFHVPYGTEIAWENGYIFLKKDNQHYKVVQGVGNSVTIQKIKTQK